jgi:lysine 2,3-aminomutase
MNDLPSLRTLRRGSDFAEAGLGNASAIDRVAERYAVAMTPLLAELAEPAINKQFVPDIRELDTDPNELSDPIGDHAHSPVNGIVHRYPDRLLLTPLLHCPVYCRFCFRRERVGGAEKALSDAELAAALDYIRAHDEVWEVILTGGDPLMLTPARLRALLAELDAIPHVEIVRIHSRIPIADPERIDIESLRLERATLWLAVHANHASEFSPQAADACRKLSSAGIPLLGQTVLLKDVNDRAEVLEELFRTMVKHRIKPYYLHHLDLAPGTGHFRTSIEQGQELVRGLRGKVSGLCQPTYVLDIPGGHGKAPIGPQFLQDGKVTDWQGRNHNYSTDVDNAAAQQHT